MSSTTATAASTITTTTPSITTVTATTTTANATTVGNEDHVNITNISSGSSCSTDHNFSSQTMTSSISSSSTTTTATTENRSSYTLPQIITDTSTGAGITSGGNDIIRTGIIIDSASSDEHSGGDHIRSTYHRSNVGSGNNLTTTTATGGHRTHRHRRHHHHHRHQQQQQQQNLQQSGNNDEVVSPTRNVHIIQVNKDYDGDDDHNQQYSSNVNDNVYEDVDDEDDEEREEEEYDDPYEGSIEDLSPTVPRRAMNVLQRQSKTCCYSSSSASTPPCTPSPHSPRTPLSSATGIDDNDVFNFDDMTKHMNDPTDSTTTTTNMVTSPISTNVSTTAVTITASTSRAASTSNAGDHSTNNSSGDTKTGTISSAIQAPMSYLSPLDSYYGGGQLLSRSTPSTPGGSNISIVGSLISATGCSGVSGTSSGTGVGLSTRKPTIIESMLGVVSGNSAGSWRLRSRYAKRRDRPALIHGGGGSSSDRERQTSVCSDSETDSISGALVMAEDYMLGSASQTNKKWSLPLPIVTRSSESDSASSSWSGARSDAEVTEDERSPVPSPSASTHSGEFSLSIGNTAVIGSLPSPTVTPTISPKAAKAAAESEARKLALKTKETEEFLYSKASVSGSGSGGNSGGSMMNLELMKSTYASGASASGGGSGGGGGGGMTVLASTSKSSDIDPNICSSSSGKKKEVKFKTSKEKKSSSKKEKKKSFSKAAETHDFVKTKSVNFNRCYLCEHYVYIWGYLCQSCQMICHRKCVKKLPICCPEKLLPPKSSIINVDLDTYDLTDEHGVPILVSKCTTEIERRCMTALHPGLYRMTGVASRVEKLLKSFETGPQLIDLTDCQMNDLTSTLKIFLRSLKDPLITNNVYKEFIDIGRIYRRDQQNPFGLIPTETQTAEMIRAIRVLLSRLSHNRQQTLRFMINHIRTVVELQNANASTGGNGNANIHQQNTSSMSPFAIAIIFAPTFFKPRDMINDIYVEVFEMNPQARVLELMIVHYDRVFASPYPMTPSTMNTTSTTTAPGGDVDSPLSPTQPADDNCAGSSGANTGVVSSTCASDAESLISHHRHFHYHPHGAKSPPPPISPLSAATTSTPSGTKVSNDEKGSGGGGGGGSNKNGSNPNLMFNPNIIGSTLFTTAHHRHQMSALASSGSGVPSSPLSSTTRSHMQIRRTSSSSSASPSPSSGCTGGSIHSGIINTNTGTGANCNRPLMMTMMMSSAQSAHLIAPPTNTPPQSASSGDSSMTPASAASSGSNSGGVADDEYDESVSATRAGGQRCTLSSSTSAFTFD